MNSNRGIFFRLATSGFESVSARKHLEIFSIPFERLFARSEAEERTAERRAGEFLEMNGDGYGDGSIKIRAFPRLAFSTSRRRFTSPEARFGFRPASSCQFNFRGKNKAPLVASFSRHRLLAFAFGDSRERASEPWGNLESARSIAQGQNDVVNARHALTPSGCICIQQRKQRCWSPLVHRYAPLGSFSLNIDEGRCGGNFSVEEVKD